MFNTPVPFTRVDNFNYKFSVEVGVKTYNYEVKFKTKYDILDHLSRIIIDDLGGEIYELIIRDEFGFYGGTRFINVDVKKIISTVLSIIDDFSEVNELYGVVIQIANEKRSPTTNFYEQILKCVQYKDFIKSVTRFDTTILHCYYKQNK